ncbi:MAG: recombination-associated protein RdgC [Lysobacterales bacterium]|jgi:recombination associated protein RdgC|nr:MAG: recombination-associated protein RdgC [Xanthomonadales bacterium]
MLFRTLFLYRSPALPSDAELERALASASIREPGALEPFCLGFASPWGGADERLVLASGPRLLLRFVRAERVLPASVLAAAVEDLAAAFRRAEGRDPARSLRRRWRAEKLAELLPRALVRRRSGWVLLDRGAGWIALAASSRARAEEALSLLRSALGHLPARPIRPRRDPAARFTAWVSGEALPAGFSLGEGALLRGEDGARVRIQGSVPRGEAIRAYLAEGLRVVRLELGFRERLVFELREDLSLARIRMVGEFSEDESGEDRLASQFALEAGELSLLFGELQRLFEIAEAEENEKAIPTPLSVR